MLTGARQENRKRDADWVYSERTVVGTGVEGNQRELLDPSPSLPPENADPDG